MRKIFLYVLTIAMVISLAAPFASFAEEDVIEISNAAELAAIGTDETTLAGNYKLTADIEAETGISGNFIGTFDGDGHTVSGLTTALFETIGDGTTGATVKNVTVDATITGASTHGSNPTATTFEDPTRVGILTQKINPDCVVENVTTCGSIDWDSAGFATMTGGIAGETWAGSASSDPLKTITISGCTNKATITVANTVKIGSVGGIVGFCTGYGTLEVTQCVNEGNIVLTGGHTSPAGIVGRFNEAKDAGTSLYPTGMLTECANLGDITVNNRAGGEYTCGIVASIKKGTISKCYNVGELTDSNGAFGIFGYTNADNNTLTVEYCYNATEAAIKGELWHTLKGATNVTILNCYYLAGRSFAAKADWTGDAGAAGKREPLSADTVADIAAALSAHGYVANPDAELGYPVLPFQIVEEEVGIEPSLDGDFL